MKNKNYRECRLKKQLRSLKDDGKKSVLWKLSQEQAFFIQEILGFPVKKELFYVRSKKFPKERLTNPLLRDLHFAAIKGKDHIVLENPSSETLRFLRNTHIHYSVLKYRIILNQKSE